MMPTLTQIVLVGHCGADSWMLERVAKDAAASGGLDAEVIRVNHQDQLDALSAQCLLLVNRVLDGSFTAGTGMDLIAEVAGRDDPPKMMLISNYEDAQAAAVEAGAAPGFGKSDIGSDDVREKIVALVTG